jgi:hypothetical protein
VMTCSVRCNFSVMLFISFAKSGQEVTRQVADFFSALSACRVGPRSNTHLRERFGARVSAIGLSGHRSVVDLGLLSGTKPDVALEESHVR